MEFLSKSVVQFSEGIGECKIPRMKYSSTQPTGLWVHIYAISFSPISLYLVGVKMGLILFYKKKLSYFASFQMGESSINILSPISLKSYRVRELIGSISSNVAFKYYSTKCILYVVMLCSEFFHRKS
jgi:hypothetical protein